ncbi:hypothetical protein GCM10027020_10400 [Nocardioides salsibiostraticola]
MKRLTAILSNRLYLSALGVLLVFLGGLSYLYSAVLDQSLTSRPDRVTVELRNAGGLFEGSAVTYRGTKIGKVTDIIVGTGGVEATVSLTTELDVPSSSRAQVRSLSPAGEQYLDFQPASTDGPYLRDGSVVAADATDLPKSLGSTVVAINKVLRQIDDQQLRTLLLELSTGLSGTGDDLGLLVDQGDAILAELDRVWPQTERLLVNGEKALDIVPDKRAELEDLADTASSLARFLKGYDPELEAQIKRTPAQLDQMNTLVRDAREVLPDFLSTGVSLTDIFVARDPHLRALLQSYSPGLGTLGDAIWDNKLQLEVILDQDPRCRYDTTRRDRRDPTRTRLDSDGSCSASFSTLQRGAAHAPGPVR